MLYSEDGREKMDTSRYYIWFGKDNITAMPLTTYLVKFLYFSIDDF